MIAAVTPTDDRGSGDGSVTGDLLRGADKFAGRGGKGSSMPQEVGPNNLDLEKTEGVKEHVPRKS